jgi:trans-aconitate 2-methyltransferase
VSAAVRDWDAASYQRVSVPHEEWAKAVLGRLSLRGDETVLDAGCGTGRLTRMLVERLPQGRVIAVDSSPAMVAEVAAVLRPGDRACVGDLTALELPELLDAVVSSAVFHWISDHDLLFRKIRATLRPGGELAAQCGGAGNLEEFRAVSDAVAARQPYASGLKGFEEPWFYAGAGETEARLQAAGFTEEHCWLQRWDVVPSGAREFMRTLILKPQLDLLPEELHERFLTDVLAARGEPLALRYVRLNIEAIAG